MSYGRLYSLQASCERYVFGTIWSSWMLTHAIARSLTQLYPLLPRHPHLMLEFIGCANMPFGLWMFLFWLRCPPDTALDSTWNDSSHNIVGAILIWHGIGVPNHACPMLTKSKFSWNWAGPALPHSHVPLKGRFDTSYSLSGRIIRHSSHCTIYTNAGMVHRLMLTI